jgi:hypothetical protein
MDPRTVKQIKLFARVREAIRYIRRLTIREVAENVGMLMVLVKKLRKNVTKKKARKLEKWFLDIASISRPDLQLIAHSLVLIE